ncbi:perilipin-2-like [Pseudophryne corroboree]|uniref:perilipin-2-like n=1 Tax=Pseudophryne corroboree TaxID=495146 RepID=UPI003081F02A
MAETVEQQNVVVRLINLPLVSSTYDMVSSAYIHTKDNHPYLKSVCNVAERSVENITSVAVTSARPILQRLEPQIALANIACIGLDKIEVKLPILYQPTDKVVSTASEAVLGAKDVVVQSISGVVGRTMGAVQDGVAMTKAAVNGGISTVMGSRVDTALTTSESLLEQYLPPTDEELAKEATKTEGFEVAAGKPSYYVRLGSLSTKARKRAYQQALTRMMAVKCRSQEAIAQLQNTVNLIEFARKNMNGANQKIRDTQDRMYHAWVEWTKSTGQQASGEAESVEQIESLTLTIARHLTLQLQTTCLSLVTGVQGLPQNIQSKAQNISVMATEVYQNFRSASSIRDMSDGLLATSKEQFTKMKSSMDDVMDYLVNNTPLNWLVVPFYPQPAGCPHGEEEADVTDSANRDD